MRFLANMYHKFNKFTSVIKKKRGIQQWVAPFDDFHTFVISVIT